MYKNTKSTSHYSIEKKRASGINYLEKIYESSKTIFVGRKIISLKEFGDIPTSPPLALISANKKYLLRIGYFETYINQLPDWFLFHPKLSLLIKRLRDAGYLNPGVIPFELELIAFGNQPVHRPKPNSSNFGKRSSVEISRALSKPIPPKNSIEIAFEKAKNPKIKS